MSKRNLFINGEWVTATGNAEFPVYNPATEEVWTHVADASREDAKAAIAAAKQAQPAWAALPHSERARIIAKAGEILEKRAKEIQEILVPEAGSWIGKAMFETNYSAGVYRAAAAAAYQVTGEILPSDLNKLSLVAREPLGVVTVISPWNFPVILSSRGIAVALAVGAGLVEDAAARAQGEDAAELLAIARRLVADEPLEGRRELALSERLLVLMRAHPDRSLETRYDKVLPVVVDRERARFSAWYEFFPRSTADEGERHGTFESARKRLPYIARLGFDVVYLPPIHPIGRTKRKGANNALASGPDDPGSPWAIGAEEGGHKDVHPALGTLEDFRAFCAEARRLGLEVA
ncbi:MAG: aldehyde dehydrogenase family protein, partial [Gammaproteobacteria bacterium]